MNVFKELYQNRKLIWKLSKNDFRNKFAGAYFGIVWADGDGCCLFCRVSARTACTASCHWISVYLLAGFRYYSVVLLF